MRLAETVTFGGSGLDRAAELREDAEHLAAVASGDAGRHICLWQGKVLLDQNDRLLRLQSNAGILESAREAPIFLGREGDTFVFAHDLVDWQPSTDDTDTVGDFFDNSRQVVAELEGAPAFVELRAAMPVLTPRDAELAATAKAVQSWHQSHMFCSRCGAKSTIASGGWRRDCDVCSGQHFPRTDPVVIMLIVEGNSVLVGRSPGWPEGMYSLLAGFVEPGETLEAAVRREVFEESGIRVGQVDYLASQPWPFPASLMFGCSGQAKAREITIDRNELDDAIWLTREEMLDVFAGEHPTIWAPRKGSIAHFILENWLKDRLD